MFKMAYEGWSCDIPRRDLLREESCEVAPKLLGMLIEKGGSGLIITEVEAYGGSDDEASHAFRGRTRRNTSMFEDGGTLYVYLSYGIHRCINIVTGESGVGQAVLVRSGIFVTRSNEPSATECHGEVVRGPGRVGRRIGAQLGDDGVDLLKAPSWRLLDTRPLVSIQDTLIARSTRVGISKGREAQWRFELDQQVLQGFGSRL